MLRSQKHAIALVQIFKFIKFLVDVAIERKQLLRQSNKIRVVSQSTFDELYLQHLYKERQRWDFFLIISKGVRKQWRKNIEIKFYSNN